MARGDRFRHLRTSRTGDLFEHFGVDPKPAEASEAPEPGAAPRIVAAAACSHCGWLRPLPLPLPCPLCGAAGRETATT